MAANSSINAYVFGLNSNRTVLTNRPANRAAKPGTRYAIKGADHGDLAFLGDPEAGRKWTTQKVMGTKGQGPAPRDARTTSTATPPSTPTRDQPRACGDDRARPAPPGSGLPRAQSGHHPVRRARQAGPAAAVFYWRSRPRRARRARDERMATGAAAVTAVATGLRQGGSDRMFGFRERRKTPQAESGRGGGMELVLPSADPEERANALSWLQEHAGRHLDSGALADREDMQR